MSLLDQFARALLKLFALLARLMLTALETVESALRGLMATAKLTGDGQTLLLLVMLAVFLFAGMRLLKGRLRSVVSLTLGLTLAHTLEHLARG